MYSSSCVRENFLRITTWKRLPSATRWKVVLPRSIPIDLICDYLHGDDPPSGFLPTTIITPVGFLDGGPSHYPHFTH